MKIREYLLEYKERRTKSISKDDAIDMVSKNCMNAFNKSLSSFKICRDIGTNSLSYGFVDPTKGEPRKSANTENYYTLIIDNSKRWKSYPKRSRSIICSNMAPSSETHIVLPFDNSKIGICPTSDMWWSFEKSFNNILLNDVNMYLNILFHEFDIKVKSDCSFTDLKSYLNTVDETINSQGFFSKSRIVNFIKFMDKYIGSKMSMFEFIDTKMDPIKNNFKVVKVGDSILGEKEVWTDGKSVLVQSNLFNDFVDGVKKKHD